MRHIIAVIATLLAGWATVYMIGLDKEVNKLDKISKLIKSTAMEDSKIKVQTHTNGTAQTTEVQNTNKQDDEIANKVKALKEKAGNIAAFKTSTLYKKSCSSCHGNIGQGIIGPKVIGKDKAYLLKALKEFKSGKRKNYVMYGLLGNLDDSQIEELASEIATFQTKLDEASK